MRRWFYAEAGKPKGPFPEDQVIQMLEAGQLHTNTLVWTHGMEQWAPAVGVEGLVSPDLFPPPLPPVQVDAVERDQPVFLYVPIARLILMSILSCGVYMSYWVYKNWRYLKERDRLKIHPLWRGILSIFYIYATLKAIKTDAETNDVEPASFSPAALAAGWIIFAILGNVVTLPNTVGTTTLGVIIAFLSLVFLVPVQNYINRVNERISPNTQFTPWTTGHVVCLIIGLVCWLLVISALLLD